MNILKNKSILISLGFSIIVALFVSFLWNFGGDAFSFFKDLVLPENAVFSWWNALILVLLSLVVGFCVEKLSTKKVLPPIICYIALWFFASLLAAQFLEISLMFVPVTLTVCITLFVVHLKKLWTIDSEFTEKLVYLASTGHLLEGKSADLRIESGLKLLETILPVSEAIVFRYELNGELNPIGRARNEEKNNSAVARQSSWRENVELCEEALQNRQTVVKSDDKEKGAARIALPLIYENTAIGVLFVKVERDFESADATLLEAFSGQLAQNFQRRELRKKSLPHQHWWSSFSTFSSENRLDIISLIQGIIKEQSFSAIASSYLKEAHAIAYLDGTLAYLNRQMRHLAQSKRARILSDRSFHFVRAF